MTLMTDPRKPNQLPDDIANEVGKHPESDFNETEREESDFGEDDAPSVDTDDDDDD